MKFFFKKKSNFPLPIDKSFKFFFLKSFSTKNKKIDKILFFTKNPTLDFYIKQKQNITTSMFENNTIKIFSNFFLINGFSLKSKIILS